MIILEDLIVDNQADSVVESIGVENDEPFAEMPAKCLHCKSRKMEAVEVLGAKDEPILWACLKCDALFLKFSRSETEVLLANAKGLWTSPLDWGFVERELFN
tara:strand:- start:31 stop:336 length:306 start_codon:yes stop_codon:yes gene_type:complete